MRKGWVLHVVTCEAHGKRAWTTRREARHVAKRTDTSGHLRAYPCDAHDGYWHVGHIPHDVIKGRRTIAEIHKLKRQRIATEEHAVRAE